MFEKYVLVRHTGYSQSGHTDFERAVEERFVTSGVARKIELAGGVALPTYDEAVAGAEAVNYPPGTGLVPQALGKFKKIAGFEEEIYVPHISDLTRGRLP